MWPILHYQCTKSFICIISSNLGMTNRPAFVCPISSKRMRHPVCTVDGHTYEQAAIKVRWRARLRVNKLLTKSSTKLTSNHKTVLDNSIKGMVCRWQHDLAEDWPAACIHGAGPQL